ncbi:MAG: ABC transporter ATP-binding protein [Candidatus Gracilibacteria bacterium]
MMPLLEVKSLSKSYGTEKILSDVSFSMEQGKVVAISGPSGSGKTTLLHMIAGLITPEKGEIFLDGTDILLLSESARLRILSEEVGVVFQAFHLLPYLTVEENISLPLLFKKESAHAMKKRISYILERVGLKDHEHKKISELSGGQRQRVAVARALLHKPKLILADEPTGNLDEMTATQVTDLLETLAREEGASVLLVTHEQAYLEKADEIWDLKEKKLVKR